MAIGPVQLLVLGFNEPNFQGEILAELDRLKENDVVRVIDAIAVYKDAEGDVAVLKRTDLSDEEAAELMKDKDAILVYSVGGGDLERNISPNIVKAVDLAKARSAGARKG